MSNDEAAAASLFGTEDSASDPFAALGGNADDISHGMPEGTPFSTGVTTSSSDDFFNQQSREWGMNQGSANATHTIPQQPTYNSVGWQHQQEYSPYAPNDNAHETRTPYQPGNYAALSHTSPYSPYQQQHKHDQNTTHVSQPSAPTASPYEPPQSTRQSTYAMDYTTPARQANTVSQSTYGQPSYASYSPVSNTYQSAPSIGTNHPTIPQPPPVTSSTITRPKVSNAYDPPVIASRPSKKTVRSGLTTPFAGDPYAQYSQSGISSSPPQPHSPPSAQHPNSAPAYHPPTRNSYLTPPPRGRGAGQGEYVPAYGYEYAPPPPPPPASQYHQEGQPPGNTNHAPPPPPFKRPPSSQVAEHFGASRSSSRAISRTSSPLASHVYNAPPQSEEQGIEHADPTSMAQGVGLGLRGESVIEKQNQEADLPRDKTSPGNTPSPHWSIVEAEEAEKLTEDDIDFEVQKNTSPDLVGIGTQPAASQVRVPSPPVKSSSTYDIYTPKRINEPAVAKPPVSSRSPPLSSSSRMYSPPARPMSAAATTTDPYAPNKPERVVSPPIRSASALPGASRPIKQAPQSWAPLATDSTQQNAEEAPVDYRALSPEGISSSSTTIISQNSPKHSEARMRSTSNGSVLSNGYTADPYSPPQHQRRATGDKLEFRSYPATSSIQAYPEIHSVQELTAPVTRAPYAPSPSLLGSNDPLGRTNARAPIFTFGFGGKVAACFHGASLLNTGFDVALSSRKSAIVQIRTVKATLPDLATDSSPAVFPGPLFSDPGSPTSLVRTGLSSQTKGKKAKLVKYLEDRAAELSASIAYLQFDVAEKSKMEGKLALVYLLKIMVEHEGRLSGSPEIDRCVRNVLLGRAPGAESEVSEGVFTTAVELSGSGTNLYGQTGEDNEVIIASTTLKQSMLEKIQDFLTQGERRQAYHYALDHKLWAHAMVIASSIDKEAWNEAINEFIRAEVGSRPGSGSGDSASSGWEGLRMTYSSFSGQGAASVSQMIPQSPLTRLATNTLTPMAAIPTPATPHFTSSVALAKIPPATLSQWMSTVAMLYTSPVTPELSATLTGLGDQLAFNEWTAAAHVCYLLSAQPSLIGGTHNNAVRIVLLGSPSPQVHTHFHTDHDAVILTEILEYAFSLTVPVKGQEPFGGLPHLQSYKLARAASIAESGDIKLAQRYCDAISACTHKPSPYLGPVFMEQLKSLTDKLVAAPHVDKGSWIPAKRPTLGAIGGWLEGRVTKFIEGGSESETSKDEDTFNGPFSHYGTISSNGPPVNTPPQASASNLSIVPPPPPGPPTLTPSTYAPINRASSAMDYSRKRQNTAPQAASAGPWASSFPQSSSFGSVSSSYPDGGNPYGLVPNESDEGLTPTTHEDTGEGAVQEASWWGNSGYGGNYDSETPTTATFHKVEGGVPEDTEGFISLMDNVQPFVATPSPPVSRSVSNTAIDEEDEEDLGISTRRKPKAEAKEEPETKTEAKQEDASAKTAAQTNAANNGSWLGRLFGRGGGPVKASLGEETTFYFDKELGRWVNKKAGAAESPPAPTPPPPRAQTASPSTAAPPNGSHPPTPPVRAATAVNGGGPPTVLPPRIRANLTPIDSSAPPPTPPPASAGLQPPRTPMDRPRSQASKRNVRSRYVDVFQSEGGGGQ